MAPPDNDRGRPLEEAPSNVVTTDMPTVSLAVDTLTHLQVRVVQDAIASASAAQLERRAQQFLEARPKPGEFLGSATRDELNARWSALTEIAEALQNKAKVCRTAHAGIDPDVWEAIAC